MGIKQEQVDTAFKLQFEARMQKDLMRVYRQMINDATLFYDQTGTALDTSVYNASIAGVLYLTWLEIRKKFGTMVNQMLVDTPTFEQFKELVALDPSGQLAVQDIVNSMNSQATTMNVSNMNQFINMSMDSISRTNNKQIVAVAALGLSTALFKSKLTDLYTARVNTISQTTVQNASETTKDDYFTTIDRIVRRADPNAPKKTKTWRAVLDDRTRPAHADADGQTVPMNEFYVVDGELLEFPGDTRFSTIGNTVNCRCSSIINF
jgi:hypothetical protein